MPPRYARLFALILFVATLVAWPFIFTGYGAAAAGAFINLGIFGPGWLLIFILCIIAIAWIPPIAGPVDRFLTRMDHATRSRPFACSLLGGVMATAYLALTAYTERRHLFPAMHDEFSYLIQARQFASGHLWMPPHPLAPFFDSFQILVEPVYASVYFPGTAMLYVPGIWLHLPPHITTLLISGAIAGLLFWITTELLGGLAGWLALLLLFSDIVFRQLSVMTLAQLPLLLYALLATAAWLRWRKTGKLQSAILIGVFLGLAAITRPVDALCFALPIGVSILCHRKWRTIFAVIVGAMPFLCFQLVLDKGITGHWLQTPFGLYADRDYPGTSYGFHPFNPDAKPASDLPQKQMLYQTYVRLIKEHQPANLWHDFHKWRLPLILSQQSPVPYPLLVMLCPLALQGLTKPRAVVMSSLPLLLIFYSAYVFFMPHYVMVAAPAVILAILVGADSIVRLSTDAGSELRRRTGSDADKTRFFGADQTRRQRFARILLTLFIAGQAIAALPQIMSIPDHDVFGSSLLESVNQQLATLPHRPAVVLFTFDPKRNLDEEPVFNADVAWPDDAQIIRANDLGPQKNRELFEYYAKHQPNRQVYRFDEATRKLIPFP